MLDSTLLNCFEKSVMPSLIFSLSLLFLKKDFSSASSFLIYCAFSIFFCVFFNKVPRAQCQLSSSNIQAGAELSMKELKPQAAAAYPPPTVLSTSSNCCRDVAVVAPFRTPLQILLQWIPFLVVISISDLSPEVCFSEKCEENPNQMGLVYTNGGWGGWGRSPSARHMPLLSV